MSNDTGQLFQGEKDRFQGVTIDSTKEPCDAEAFGEMLKGTVQSDKQKKLESKNQTCCAFSHNLI